MQIYPRTLRQDSGSVVLPSTISGHFLARSERGAAFARPTLLRSPHSFKSLRLEIYTAESFPRGDKNCSCRHIREIIYSTNFHLLLTFPRCRIFHFKLENGSILRLSNLYLCGNARKKIEQNLCSTLNGCWKNQLTHLTCLFQLKQCVKEPSSNFARRNFDRRRYSNLNLPTLITWTSISINKLRAAKFSEVCLLLTKALFAPNFARSNSTFYIDLLVKYNLRAREQINSLARRRRENRIRIAEIKFFLDLSNELVNFYLAAIFFAFAYYFVFLSDVTF